MNGVSSPQAGITNPGGYNVHSYNGIAADQKLIAPGSATSPQVLSTWQNNAATFGMLNFGSLTELAYSYTPATTYIEAITLLINKYPIVIQWMRIRAVPPNGVMPSVTFGSVS